MFSYKVFRTMSNIKAAITKELPLIYRIKNITYRAAIALIPTITTMRTRTIFTIWVLAGLVAIPRKAMINPSRLSKFLKTPLNHNMFRKYKTLAVVLVVVKVVESGISKEITYFNRVIIIIIIIIIMKMTMILNRLSKTAKISNI